LTHDRAHVRLFHNAHADYIEAQYRGMQRCGFSLAYNYLLLRKDPSAAAT
jgi:hypothetical protein